MGKEEVKSKIREALERSPLRKKIEKLSLFGSYAKGGAKAESDVDVLVEFRAGATIGFFNLSELKNIMEQVLNKKVDLVTPDAISRYLKEGIINESELIYER